VAAAGTFALAGMMFFIIPRVGQATLPFRAELGRRISGFTDHVELGAYGEIETDTTVVMRVRFPDDLKDPERLPNLRWRGLVFDSFDGRVWTAGERQRLLLRREATGEFAIAAPRGTGPIVRQEIFLDPIGTDAVFVAPRALRVELRGARSGSTTWAASPCPRPPPASSTPSTPSSRCPRRGACARAGRARPRPRRPAISSFRRSPSASPPWRGR